jgi:hypothetical protein
MGKQVLIRTKGESSLKLLGFLITLGHIVSDGVLSNKTVQLVESSKRRLAYILEQDSGTGKVPVEKPRLESNSSEVIERNPEE